MADIKPTHKYEIPCMDCGALVPSNQRRARRCKTCRPAYQAAATMRHYRKTFTPSKPRSFECQSCSRTFESFRVNVKWCPECRDDAVRASGRDYYRANAERQKMLKLARKYGITLDQYDEMVLDQEGRCAICLKTTDVLCIDHCHETGVVRGLLCRSCNTAIGRLGDNLEGIYRAVTYLSGGDLVDLSQLKEEGKDDPESEG